MFEIVVAQIGDVQEDQSLGYFMSGLREEIRRRMIVHAPRTMDQAMMLARGLERELYGTAVDWEETDQDRAWDMNKNW